MSEGRPPNLLLIMCDQLRATALGMYGDSRTGRSPVRTPNLDALAASGVLYRYAFTPFPQCVPARVAMWTGRWPHVNGSRSNQIYLQPGETHLVGLLKEAGYATGLIGKNHCFTAPDIERHFDTYYPVGHGGPAEDGGDPEVAAAKAWIREHGGGGGGAYQAMVSPFPVEKHGTWLVGDRAAAFFRASRERPFCAWVSIADPHTPYQVSQPYASLYPPETLELPPREARGYADKPERLRRFAARMGADEVDEQTLRRALSIYYGMIAVIDETVGRLMAALEELGLREDTIVVFTADHGDYMAEHGFVRKDASLYDSLTRVPLLLSFPGRVPAGEQTDALVSLVDLFPTLAELMGLPLPPGRSGQPLPVATSAPSREAVYAETGFEGRLQKRENGFRPARRTGDGEGAGAQPAHFRGVKGRIKMVRTHEWKYVHQPGEPPELYDLRRDPHELVNLAARPEHHERLCEMQRMLLDWTIESEDTLPPPARNPDAGV